MIQSPSEEPPPLYVLPAPYSPAWLDLTAELGFAACVSAVYDLDVPSVWRCLDRLPSNYVHLLGTPQGWGIVADWIASELGASRDVFLVPTIH